MDALEGMNATSSRSPDREPQPYISYLLRLRQVRQDKDIVWRTSLQNARTGERIGFATVEALLSYLREQTEAASGE